MQGHWRKIPSSHKGEGRYGEETYGRTWVDREESKAATKAKKRGKVPPPVLVKVEKDFAVFAVPGGNIMFVVHASIAKDFIDIANSSEGNWTDNKKIKAIMVEGEKSGKFGIFKTKEPVIPYNQ